MTDPAPSDGKRAAAAPSPADHLITPASIEELLGAVRRSRFIVIGDVMLDVVLSGPVERICPEAPVPVLTVEREDAYLGGAANVANNLAPYARDIVVMGIIGEDLAGHRLVKLVETIGGRAEFAAEPDRPTTTKTRMVSVQQQILRADSEVKRELSEESADRLLATLDAELTPDTIVFASDYAKGCLPRWFFERVAKLVRARGAKLLVDPKVRDLAHYRGAWLVKPNRKEAEEAAGFALRSAADAERAAALFREQADAQAILITLGSDGLVLSERHAAQPDVPAAGAGETATLHLPTEAREVYDVTGAGDTVLAFLGLGLAAGWPLGRAAALANVAAGVTISKRGTARVEPHELMAAVAMVQRRSRLDHKVLTRSEVERIAESIREQGRRLVFTNGCFDLFHPGHFHLLRKARELGDALVVGINSDESIRRIKGEASGRPFIDERGRLQMLCPIEYVDYVVVFDEDTPEELIRAMKPAVLAKGANYSVDEVIGAPIVREYGGEVVVMDVAPDYSVTTLSRAIAAKLADEE